MEINQAKPIDLIEILFLLRACIRDMNENGMKHWNSTSPSAESIQSDLANGSIYLIKDKGVCKGMVTLNDHVPEDYKSIEFPSGGKKPLYMQNMAVHPKWQGKGIAKKLVDFAQKYARENGHDCIRLDVFETSETAKQLCEKQLFRKVAVFRYEYQKIPFICYEKQI